MDYNFRRQEIGDVVSLQLDVGAEMEMDEFALHMLNRNDPVHLVPVQFVRRDSAYYLQYDINDMQPLQNRLAGRLERKDAIHILNNVIEAFEEVEDYMLTEDVLVLDMNYVYMDAARLCRFLCVPCKREESDRQILFLRSVVERMMLCYADADTLLYDLINAYNRDGIRKISDMKDILRKLGDTESAKDKAEPVVDQGGQADSGSGLQRSGLEKSMPKEPEAIVRNPAVPQENSVGKKKTEKNKAPSTGFAVPGQEKSDLPVGFAIPGQEKSGSSAGFAIPGREEAAFQIPKKEEGRKGKAKKEGKKEAKKETAPKTGIREGKPKIGIVGKMFRKNDTGSQEVQIPVPGNDRVNDVSDMYESYEATVMMSDVELPEIEAEHTQMLGMQSLSGILVRKKTQEQFCVGAGESVIGSGSAAACVISGNKAISRQHAVLRIEEDRISITDNHSSNGTWVDGKKLVTGNTVFIGNRAVIKLADEEFIFTVNI